MNKTTVKEWAEYERHMNPHMTYQLQGGEMHEIWNETISWLDNIMDETGENGAKISSTFHSNGLILVG